MSAALPATPKLYGARISATGARRGRPARLLGENGERARLGFTLALRGFREGWGTMFFKGGNPVEVKHCCVDCGQVIVMHEHSSYIEVKNCLAGMRALCDACASWPGSPSAEATEAGRSQHGK